MTDYQGYTAGEITIHHDRLRMSGQWYARVPLNGPDESGQPVFRRLLARQESLEITLSGPKLLKANPIIIEELQRRGISTTNLKITPYTKNH